jgi:hypothetical protein
MIINLDKFFGNHKTKQNPTLGRVDIMPSVLTKKAELPIERWLGFFYWMKGGWDEKDNIK